MKKLASILIAAIVVAALCIPCGFAEARVQSHSSSSSSSSYAAPQTWYREKGLVIAIPPEYDDYGDYVVARTADYITMYDANAEGVVEYKIEALKIGTAHVYMPYIYPDGSSTVINLCHGYQLMLNDDYGYSESLELPDGFQLAGLVLNNQPSEQQVAKQAEIDAAKQAQLEAERAANDKRGAEQIQNMITFCLIGSGIFLAALCGYAAYRKFH